ncbi:MAG: alpha-2-macroglobulin family protein [Gemmataceae bacterium]
MLNCQACSSQMLEYLYDLLEGEERQTWEAHLRECDSCQVELRRVRDQRLLLAKAAKMEFADVVFTPPSVAVTPTASEAIRTRRQSRPSHRRHWLVAAAVLVALGGVAVPAVWYDRDYQQVKGSVALAENRIEQAKRARLMAEQQLAQLPGQRQARIESILKAQRESQLQVRVQGPASIRAGAPTDYQIFTTSLTGQPADADLSVEVQDNNSVTLGRAYPVSHVAAGVYRLTLPPDLPIRPNSQPSLVVAARRNNGPKVELRETMDLAAPVYLTHLEIDKPMYQLGETVHFRSLTLDRISLTPPECDLNLRFFLATPGPGNPERLIAQGRTSLVENGPNGVQPLLGPDGKPLRGIGAGSFVLDENEAGGEYALIVREANRRFPEQRRKFLVNKYEKPKLNKELDFSRKSYGPGDEVAARCKAKHLDGRPLKNCRVEATVFLDSRQYGSHGEESREALIFQTDDEGVVNVRFRLPKEIERGLGTVAVKFDDRAMPDTIVRPLPIVLKKLDIEFCPEGGDLVAGLRNRVYFQVRDTLGKPADLRGRLLEDGKPLDALVETLGSEKAPELNHGMGRFEFTPRAGRKYELKVETPVGVTKLHELPPIQPQGVVLSVVDGVVKAEEPIRVRVRSTGKRSFMVGAYCRGRLLDSIELSDYHFLGDEARAELRPSGGAGGVCRVTVFEILPGDAARRELRPVAERLIYRQPAERVQLELKPDQKSYVPRQTVKLDVEATDQKGDTAAAIVMVRVVDKSVITLADDKTLRTMPAHFLLTTEVRRPEDLEYADFLLGAHPQAAEALDLLLGTQGWRRFAEQDPGKFRNEQKEEAERLLVMIGQTDQRMTDLTTRELQNVERDHARRVEGLTARLKEITKIEEEKRVSGAYRAALVNLKEYDEFFDRLRFVGVRVGEAILVLAALVCLILGLYRRLLRAWLYYAATVACVAMAVLLTRVSLETSAIQHSTDEQFAQLREQVDRQNPPGRGAKLAEEKIEKDNPADRMRNKQKVEGQRADLERQAPPKPMQMEMAPMAKPRTAANPAAAMPDGQGAGEGKGGFWAKPMLAAKKDDRGGEAMAKQRGEEQVRRQLAQDAKRFRPLANREKMQMAGRPGPAADFGVPRGDKRAIRAPAELPPMPVREYKHVRAGGVADERFDFAETLYWHPVLVLPDGKAEVSFDLCDSLGSFEVTAFAHTLDGRLGSATKILTAQLPFTVQPRTPLEVTAGDKIDIPLAIANNTSEARSARVAVTEMTNLSLLPSPLGGEDRVRVAADTTIRKVFRFQPALQEGTAMLAFTGKADGFPADRVRTAFRIVPEGFPIVAAHSDVLEKSATNEVVLPDTWIKGTLKCTVQVYPSTLADLQKGLEALLREPGGCFEQSSTSNYPNVLILQYLKESAQTRPEIERRAHELLDRGYQQLVSFECLNPSQKKKEGYEWFGGTAPAHEALTAYGLMEFRDMAAVHEVDADMMRRTQEYLLQQRDGQGGFKRNPRALDTFGRAPQHITDAYIVWALTEGGKDDDVSKELNALHELAKKSKDPYFLSLVANSLINRARTAEAVQLLKKVSELQKADGHLDAEQTSITGSGGRDLQIETTSLALLAWLKANPGEFNASIQKGIKWLGQQRGGYGGFGSTQSTILALKALIQYTKANKKTPEAGELRLFVGAKQVAALPFAAAAMETMTLSVPDAETTLKPGKNPVRLEISGKNVFPYTLAWSYQSRQPASAANCPVKLTAQLDRAEARESETVRLNVRVENASGKGQGMAVAILGLPGGLTIPEDMKQLKDYIRLPSAGQRPLLSAFEIRGRELVLYWRDLAPDQKIDVPIDLICRVPGEYSGPASRTYLYYNADLKHWVAPLKIRIAAKSVGDRQR